MKNKIKCGNIFFTKMTFTISWDGIETWIDSTTH